MNLPFQFRASIEEMPGGTFLAEAIKTIIASVSSVWDVQHTDDGAHGTITLGSLTGPKIVTGTGSPESVITAPMGSLYLRTDGGASTTLYVKTSGTAATGWTAK